MRSVTVLTMEVEIVCQGAPGDIAVVVYAYMGGELLSDLEPCAG